MIKPRYFFIFLLALLAFAMYQVFTTTLDPETRYILNFTSVGVSVLSITASIINISKFHSLKLSQFALTGAIIGLLIPVLGRAIL